jgi:hypothetical protein
MPTKNILKIKNILFKLLIVSLIILIIFFIFFIFKFLDTHKKTNLNLNLIKENYIDDTDNSSDEDDFYLSKMKTKDYQDVISITESQLIKTT